MKLNSLQDLLIEELKDLYSVETQLLKALPKMARAATHPELRAAFEEHLEQTQGQKVRLEQIFDGLGLKPKAKTCEGMKGILAEGEETMKEEAEDATMDAALIGAAQKAEHYEIASYGTCRTWAHTLSLDTVADLLQQTLSEEEETDKRLTQLAVSVVNGMSAGGEGEEETEDEELDENAEASGDEEEVETEERVYAIGSKTRATSPAAKPTRRTSRTKSSR